MTDNNTRFCRMDYDGHSISRSFYFNFSYRSFFQCFLSFSLCPFPLSVFLSVTFSSLSFCLEKTFNDSTICGSAIVNSFLSALFTASGVAPVLSPNIIKICEDLFLIGVALPKAFGCHLFKTDPPSTVIVFIKRFSFFNLKLLTAFATQELSNLEIGSQSPLTINLSWFSATPRSMPLIKSATSLTFLGDILINFALAFISILFYFFFVVSVFAAVAAAFSDSACFSSNSFCILPPCLENFLV